MPTLLNELGFFQFDNLIRNQIPFVLLNLGADLKGLYKLSHHQNHLEKLTCNVSTSDALETLKNRKHSLHEAIVVICQSGKDSGPLVDELEAAGYLNVFMVKGGLDQLRADASR
ncbi:MAG: rhodanese-like domain-containing protein [Bdellovibrionales bacterium]